MGELTLVLVIVAIILQIVTISIVLVGKKHGGKPADAPRQGGDGKPDRKDGGDPRRAQGGSGGNRKPGDNRDRGGRPQPQGERPRQQQNQPAAIDPMEKSLRDINLRLKNAEREQENARKKIQDGGPREGRPQQQRIDRGGRGAPQQQGGRINREPRGDGGRQDRPDRPERPGRGGPDGQDQGPQFQDRPPRQPQPQYAQNAADGPQHAYPGANQPPEITPNDFGVSEDQLQHGRKFTAKRRPLPDGANGSADAPEPPVYQDAPPPEQQLPANEYAQVQDNAQTDQPQTQDDVAIQFGRR